MASASSMCLKAASRSPSLFQKSPASLVEVAASIRDKTIRR